jgi:hypothetical protein
MAWKRSSAKRHVEVVEVVEVAALNALNVEL